jgi:palmitoyltransferase
MGIIKKIVLFVLAVSFLTFVAFFGRLPAFRYRAYSLLLKIFR